MTKGIKKIWDDQPSGVKLVIIIVMIIIAIYVLNYVRGYLKTAADKASSKGEEQSYQQQGMQQSYSDSWYNSKANELETAMKGAGTDEVKIKQIFSQLQNNLDALKLNQAFGQRSYTCYAISTCSDGLRVWLEGEGMLTEVNQVMATNGITYSLK